MSLILVFSTELVQQFVVPQMAELDNKWISKIYESNVSINDTETISIYIDKYWNSYHGNSSKSASSPPTILSPAASTQELLGGKSSNLNVFGQQTSGLVPS